MMMRDVWPHFRDEYIERVCYRMVSVDSKRAKALAAAAKNYRHRARALGAMALAISRKTGDHTQAAPALGRGIRGTGSGRRVGRG